MEMLTRIRHYRAGEWYDPQILEPIDEAYSMLRTRRWYTWRYWWDLSMKEIAFIILHQVYSTQ